MTCSALRDALEALDDEASTSQMQKLITTDDFSVESLVSISEDFLRAFCDRALSHTRRRWIGVSLARMLEVSPEVAQHFDAGNKQLQGLGDIMLSPLEREDTKIVAGIVMRQALQQHIEFTKFWASDKVWNSALNFPTASTAAWLQDFQTFLDTLGDLALTNSITDPAILYPVSVFAPNSFQWVNSDERGSIAIMQQDRLTLLLSDVMLRDILFLDVPVSHISSIKARPSGPLPDSQSRITDHEPWDLIVSLKNESCTYLLNTSKRKAKELTLLFGRSEDARECENALRELQQTEKENHKRRQTRSMRSSSLLSNSENHRGRVSEGDGRARQRDEQLQPRESQHKSQTAIRRRRSREIMRRQASSPTAKAGPSSSVDLGKSPAARATSAYKLSQQTAAVPKSGRRGNTQSVPKENHTPLAPTHNDVSAARAVEDIELAPKQDESRGRTKQTANLTTQQSSQARAVANDTKSELAKILTEKPTVRADISKHTSSPTGSAHSPSESLKQNGKLPKVSHARKRKPSQQVRVEPDIFEIPSEDQKRPSVRKRTPSQLSADEVPEPRVDVKQSGVPSEAREAKTLKSKLRTKWRAEQNDDDFVPTGKSTKKIANKRKAVTEAMAPVSKPKKKAKIEHKAPARSQPSGSEINPLSELGSDGPASDMNSQRVKPQSQQVPHIPAVVSRASLIGGLLSSQHHVAGDKTAFKKPALPSRSMQTPSTPTQRPTIPLTAAKVPRTGDSQSTPRAYDAAMLSPPINGIGFGDEDDALQDEVREAEILSSNSKPLPASPHADSTAITGHADRDDIDLEKKRSEVQTAQSNPFRQRQESSRTTPFLRRLTGEKPGSSQSVSSPGMLRLKETRSPKISNSAVKIASQPLQQLLSTHEKESFPPAQKVITSQREHQKGRSANEFEIFLDRQARKSDPSLTPEAHKIMSGPTNVAKRKSPQLERGKAASKKENVALFASQLAEHETTSGHDPSEADYAHESPRVSGDITLVNDESEEPLPTYQGTPTIFPSSPPGTPGDHSSTSAEHQSSPPRSPLTSVAEEIEWEATLQPHQRDLHDQLMRVSKQVLRHVVDNETAVTDIADVYASDGEHLLKTMFARQDQEYQELWDDMDAKKVALRKELEKSTRALAKERQRVRALP